MKKMLIALTIFAASLGLTLGLPAFVSAQTTTQLKDAACMGAGGTTGCTDSGDPNTQVRSRGGASYKQPSEHKRHYSK